MVRQIKQCYGRTAQVIYAPVKLLDYPFKEDAGSYYLTVSRLISHKRVDLAVKACQALHRPLIVVGDGPERRMLESIKTNTTKFVGRVSDAELKQLYSECRAVIFPSEEDYGLVPIEAQACGRAVIAYGVGGALETIVENTTGVFFERQTVESVIEAIQRFETMCFSARSIREAVNRFDVEYFKTELRKFVLQV